MCWCALQAPKVVSNAMFASTGAFAAAPTPMPATGVPPLAGNAALGKEQQQQLPSTLAGIFSPLQSAAAAVKEGKERAAKLAASFAAGRSSGFLSVAGRITSSEAAINAPQAPSHEPHVSSAVATAAAAAKNLIHQQALKAKQSVQAMPSQTEPVQARHSVQSVPSQTQPEGEANHQSRMEAIRLRNLARGVESPLSAHQASVASSSQSPASHGTLPNSPSVPPPPPPDRSQPGTASPSQAYAAHTSPRSTPQQRAQRGRHTHFHGHGDSVSPASKDASSRPAKSSQHSPAASRLSREAVRKRAQSPVKSLTRHAHIARKRAASPDGAQSDRTTPRGGKAQPRAEQSPRGRPAKRRGRPSRAADRARRASRGSPTYSPVRGQSSRYHSSSKTC